MIKDVMVHLDGTSADERRLAAASSIAILFESHVIGLFLNVLPMVTPAEGDSAGAVMVTDLLEKALQRTQGRSAIRVPLRRRQAWAMAASFALLLTANVVVCVRMSKTQSAAENFGRTYFSFVQTPNF